MYCKSSTVIDDNLMVCGVVCGLVHSGKSVVGRGLVTHIKIPRFNGELHHKPHFRAVREQIIQFAFGVFAAESHACESVVLPHCAGHMEVSNTASVEQRHYYAVNGGLQSIVTRYTALGLCCKGAADSAS